MVDSPQPIISRFPGLARRHHPLSREPHPQAVGRMNPARRRSMSCHMGKTYGSKKQGAVPLLKT